MSTTQTGLFWIIFLSCLYITEAKLFLDNRTMVALAGKTVVLNLEVTIPANSTKSNITCYRNNHQIWTHSNDIVSPKQKKIYLTANITMHNSSCSGEYYFKYMNEKLYWVVLVRDVSYLPQTQSSVITLLVVLTVLLLLSVTGSVYVYKLYKNQSPCEGDRGKVKEENTMKKRKRNAVVTEEAVSESVYTALEQRSVSIYDMLNVHEARSVNTESQTSKKKTKSSPVEEGVFESVYENL